MIIYFFTKEVLALLNVPDEIFKDAYEYLHYMCLALFLAGIGIVVASILRVKNMANYIAIVSLITNAIVLLGNAYVLGFLSFLGLNEQSLGLKAVAMVAIVAHFSGLLLLIFFLIYIPLNSDKKS